MENRAIVITSHLRVARDCMDYFCGESLLDHEVLHSPLVSLIDRDSTWILKNKKNIPTRG